MYIYSLSQYLILVNATIIASSISMFCSILILIAYIFLRSSEPSKSRRLSLKCVFIASIADSINAIFDITSVLRNGDNGLCRASSIIKQFTRVLSSSLLMMVGINLVIVFVLNVQTSFKYELLYLIAAIMYSLVAVSVPLREVIIEPLDPDSPYRCWYHVNFYQIYGHSHILWMWFYGFLFLSIFIATCCSVISMIKLVRKHRSLMSRFVNIAASSEAGESAASHIQDRRKNQSNVFIKVIYRCVMYPLVPLICNIWGFTFQIILLHPRATPDFVLSAIDTIFGCLQGFFLAIIFFSDPTMTLFIGEKIASWKLTYLDEYTEVYTYEDGHVEIIPRGYQHFRLTSSDEDAPVIVHIDQVYQRETSSTTILPTHLEPDTYLARQCSSITYPPSAMIADHCSPSPTVENKPKPAMTPISKLPMRQMSVSSSICSRLSQPINVRSPSLVNNFDGNDHSQYTPDDIHGSCQISETLRDPDIPNKIFKPYKYPRLARVAHWVLSKCFSNNDINATESSNERKSSLSIHPLEQE